MNFRGTKITGASALTVLGVCCFIAVLVAAAALMGSVNWSNNVNDGASVSKVAPVYTGTALPDSPTTHVTYEFGVQVVGATTGSGTLYVDIGKASIAAANVVLSYSTDGVTWTPLTANEGTSGHLVYTCPTSVDLAATHTFSFQITYELAGAYAVQAYVMK